MVQGSPVRIFVAIGDRLWRSQTDSGRSFDQKSRIKKEQRKLKPYLQRLFFRWLVILPNQTASNGIKVCLVLIPDRVLGLPLRSNFSKSESELLWVGTTQELYLGKFDNWESVPDFENRTITALAWDDNASSLWVGTDLGLFRLVSQDNGWKTANEFNIHNSGLGANRVNAIALWAVAKPIALATGDSGEISCG